MQLASYMEGGPLMWMMPLHLHVNQKSDYDDDDCLTLSFMNIHAIKTPPTMTNYINKLSRYTKNKEVTCQVHYLIIFP